jgi:hypothetical protein
MRRYPPFDDDVSITPIRLPTPPRSTWFVLGAIGLLVAILAIAGPAITIGAALLWFKALGMQEVYTIRLGLQLWLFFGSLVIAFAYVAVNVLVALRFRASSVLRTMGIRRRYLRSAAGLALVAIGVIGMLGLRRRTADAAIATTTTELLRTYLRFVALTMVNPATLAYFIAVALGLGREILTDTPAFIAGVVLATGTWQSGLALVSGSLHGRLAPSTRGPITVVANVVVIALGLRILAQVFAS